MNEESGTRLALQTALCLIMLGSAVPLCAQGLSETLDVCNNGTVRVVVLMAMKNADLARGFGKYYWEIRSTAVAPGKCKRVYADIHGEGAYLGFGFEDAKGQWGSGTVAQLPDFGKYVQWFQSWPVMSRGEGTIEACVPKIDTTYAVKDDPKRDCATMRLVPSNGATEVSGPFFPITSALYFEALDVECLSEMNVKGPCQFYLNISPGGTGRELHAGPGTGGGGDSDPPMTDAQLSKALANSPVVKALARAAAEDRQKKEQAAAAAAAERQREAQANSPEGRLQHAREQQAAREQKQKQILAADAAGDPNVKIEAQMIRREEENNRQRWAGTRQSPAAYDPRWMGQNVAIVGTVSRVEVDPNGSPQWVTIYFKESPNATFVVCSPYPNLFQERVGLNLSALVGKTLEAAGQVESPYCGGKGTKGSIRVVESKQWQVH